MKFEHSYTGKTTGHGANGRAAAGTAGPKAGSGPKQAGAPDDTDKPTPRIKTLSDVEAKPVEWFWRGWIPYKAVTLLDGDPGLGKSTLTLDLAARASRGFCMPPDAGVSDRDPVHVLLLSAEDSLEHTIRPRLGAAGADVTKVHIL